jgi:hypothetical protein
VFRVKLISHDYLHLYPGEANRMMRHPYMMLFYFGLAGLFTLANWSGTKAAVPIELRASIYLLATLMGAITVFIGFTLIRHLSASKSVLTVSLSPIVFLAVVVGTSAVEAMTRPLFPGAPISTPHLMALFVFYYLMTELLLLFTISYIGPRILSDLRGVPVRNLSDTAPQDAPKTASALDDAPETASDPDAIAPALASVVPPAPSELQLLLAGEKRFVVSSLLRLHAEGNYVKVTTHHEGQLVPGPLADLVAALPDGVGCMIHRSDWIAARAVAGFHRVGRDLFVDLSDGTSAKVALPRQEDVLLWLDGLMASAGDRRPLRRTSLTPAHSPQVIPLRRARRAS